MEYRCIILIFLSVTLSTADDLIIGSDVGRQFYDKVLYAEAVFWKQVNDVTIETSPFEYISRIEVTDLRPDKKGEVVVIDGGVGTRSVTLQLRSPTRLRGFNFHVQVFAISSDVDYDGIDDRTDLKFLKFLKKARGMSSHM